MTNRNPMVATCPSTDLGPQKKIETPGQFPQDLMFGTINGSPVTIRQLAPRLQEHLTELVRERTEKNAIEKFIDRGEISTLYLPIVYLKNGAIVVYEALSRGPENSTLYHPFPVNGRLQSFAVLYLDLDNFKAYNDKYGFEQGDRIIRLAAQLLSSSLATTLGVGQFLGHIGGDDFIIIVQSDTAQGLAERIIMEFDREVLGYYDMEDLEKGFIEVKNRRGELEKFPIISMSIALVSTEVSHFKDYLQVREMAAALKKRAKQIPGSCFVVNPESR